MRARLTLPTIIASLLLATSCSEQVSQKRIQRRWESVGTTIAGIEKRERQSPKRIDEAAQTLNHWLEQESERFNERVKIIGDYAW
ncbi:MAG: hypothetical protein HBSAPP02_11730 [Phycisphaerae bacterium]|nr:MAG: hypothetical protein HRU71_08955 [Planctomycetia bacterium]RIK69755.1 MAG: hypothetical protein DCC66_07605 [Planctomycetota bacterium]GJQ26141.1 MAG: hypothetical protein HBSAPP02_11730 [Phycisphaerae bacterium]